MMKGRQRSVVLFGAGSACKNFLEKNDLAKNKIIAISDNSKDKWGSTTNGLPILAPESLKNLDFDTVIITSLWADEIYKQLINELKVPSCKIEVAPKSQIKTRGKPFEDGRTIAAARSLLISINAFFFNSPVTLYVDFGTLLGLKRDNDIISWDDDIDLSVNEEQFELALEMMKDFTRYAPKLPNVEWKVSVITRAGVTTSIKIEPVQSFPEINYFKAGISKRRNIDENSVLVGLGGMLFAPSLHFSDFDLLNAQGTQFKAPKNHESYLEFVYGN